MVIHSCDIGDVGAIIVIRGEIAIGIRIERVVVVIGIVLIVVSVVVRGRIDKRLAIAIEKFETLSASAGHFVDASDDVFGHRQFSPP
jgi:hypothetical protein